MTAHSITNIWVDLTGPDSAFSECYFQGFHDFPAEGGGRLERVVGGRYLDRHERRDGEWRIIAPDAGDRLVSMSGRAIRCGTAAAMRTWRIAAGRSRDDPLYRLHPRGVDL